MDLRNVAKCFLSLALSLSLSLSHTHTNINARTHLLLHTFKHKHMLSNTHQPKLTHTHKTLCIHPHAHPPTPTRTLVYTDTQTHLHTDTLSFNILDLLSRTVRFFRDLSAPINPPPGLKFVTNLFPQLLPEQTLPCVGTKQKTNRFIFALSSVKHSFPRVESSLSRQIHRKRFGQINNL